MSTWHRIPETPQELGSVEVRGVKDGKIVTFVAKYEDRRASDGRIHRAWCTEHDVVLNFKALLWRIADPRSEYFKARHDAHQNRVKIRTKRRAQSIRRRLNKQRSEWRAANPIAPSLAPTFLHLMRCGYSIEEVAASLNGMGVTLGEYKARVTPAMVQATMDSFEPTPPASIDSEEWTAEMQMAEFSAAKLKPRIRVPARSLHA